MDALSALLSRGLHTLFLSQFFLWREGFIGIDFVMRGHGVRHREGF